jgi:hypothetical protein
MSHCLEIVLPFSLSSLTYCQLGFHGLINEASPLGVSRKEISFIDVWCSTLSPLDGCGACEREVAGSCQESLVICCSRSNDEIDLFSVGSIKNATPILEHKPSEKLLLF